MWFLLSIPSPLRFGFAVDLALLGITTPAAPPVETAATSAAEAAAATLDWRMRLFWTGVQAFCAIFYGRLFLRALRHRGRVRAERFGPPEAGIALVLSGLIVLITLLGFLLNARLRGAEPTPAPNATEIINTVISTTMLQGLLVVGLLAGWAARHIPIAETLGFAPPAVIHWSAERPPPTLGQAIWASAGFVLAAYPLLLGALELGRLTGISHLSAGQEQEAIRLFKASAELAPKLAMIFQAVVVAPLLEEFIFRGYLYPVFRRYFGAGTGVVLNSVLFAGIHAHLPNMAPLFVLAVCLTLAYEATGSLLVPVVMHALFNSFNIALLILGLGGSGGT